MANLEFKGGGLPSVKTNQKFKKLFSSMEVTLKRFKLSHSDLKSMSNTLNQMP